MRTFEPQANAMTVQAITEMMRALLGSDVSIMVVLEIERT